MELNTTDSLILLLFLSFSLLFLKHVNQKKALKHSYKLPPPASPLPVLTHMFLHHLSIFDIAPILRRLHSLHGPIFSLQLIPFTNPSIFISDASLAHSALIHQGAAFSGRPPWPEPNRLLSSGGCNISAAPYGSLWRILRRNLSGETLLPSRIRSFASGRRWALRSLVEELQSMQSGQMVVVKESFEHAIFSLLGLMCFGRKLTGSEIREIASLQMFLLLTFTSFNVFAVIPSVTKVLFWKRWEEIIKARRKQAEIFIPMIRARRDRKLLTEGKQSGFEYCYVDSLLDVQHPDEGGRGLTDDEMVSLCHEFLTGGVDTTTAALEWNMAELVKNQALQSKILTEIESYAGSDDEIIKEEDLQKMSYLKAVVLESLRRHPPGHFLLPHSVTEDVILDGFLLPKGVQVHFAVADVNWNEKKWEEPMEFRPERFMAGGYGEDVDITGSREIKMMTFGAGRRMCPGYGLAILHLEFLVANLVKEFVWKSEEGKEVDLSEKLEFTTIMKNPLRVQLIPRRKKNNVASLHD